MKTIPFPVRMFGLSVGAAILGVCIGASAAPLITDVVETGGDNDPTDTITAKWTGTTFPVSVANEPVPGAVVGNNYTVGLFGNWAPAFVDRTHRYTNASLTAVIPAYLLGKEYIMSGNDNRDNAGYRLDVAVSQGVVAYMLIDNRLNDGDNLTPPTFTATNMQWIVDQGWSGVISGINRAGGFTVPDEIGFDEGSDGTLNQWYSVYKKEFAAGGTFSLFQADNAGRNMYGVVVAVIPEPSVLALLGVGAVALFAFRRRHTAS